MFLIDELALFIFVICIIVCIFLTLFKKNRNTPNKRNLLNLIYKNWVNHRLNEENPITAIQTLRNFTMANATFISALYILIGILIGLYSTDLLENRSFWGIPNLSLGFIKILLNIAVISYCLINFTFSIRLINRTGLLLTGKPQEYSIESLNGLDITRSSFINAQNHWLSGIRGLFFLVASLIWFVNTFFFILSTIGVTLYIILFQDTWEISKE